MGLDSLERPKPEQIPQIFHGLKKQDVCINNINNNFYSFLMNINFIAIHFILFCRSYDTLLKDFRKTVNFFKESKENPEFDEENIEEMFQEEIQKYKKDKERQRKIKEIYRSFEEKRENLLQALALKEEKIKTMKLKNSMEMVKNKNIT